MNTATGSNDARKHTRFDPSFLQGSTSKRQPPKTLTLDFIKCHTASLQENLANLLNDHITKHVTYHHCIWEKNNQLNRFREYQDLILKSARIDFKFHVSQEAEQSEEFATTKEDTDRIITNRRKYLKEYVKESIKLEIALQEQEIRDNYIEAIRLIVKGFFIKEKLHHQHRHHRSCNNG